LIDLLDSPTLPHRVRVYEHVDAADVGNWAHGAIALSVRASVSSRGGCDKSPEESDARRRLAFSAQRSSVEVARTGRRDKGANGQPAFGVYVRDPLAGIAHANGLLVVTLAGSRISRKVRFDNSKTPLLGLPRTIAR